MLITQGSLVRIQSGPLCGLVGIITGGLSARGDVAQLGERRLCKAEVRGSSPLISTKLVVLLLEVIYYNSKGVWNIKFKFS